MHANEMKSLDNKYRPLEIDQFFPTVNISMFKHMFDTMSFPNLMLFYGQPGTGKTTMARLIASRILNIDNQSKEQLILHGNEAHVPGYKEFDMAVDNSANDTRDIADAISTSSPSSLLGDSKYVFVLDEFSELNKTNQKKLVKVIKDNGIEHIHIIVITNDKSKIESSVSSRFAGKYYKFNELSFSYVENLINYIAGKENYSISKETIKTIYNNLHRKSPRDIVEHVARYIRDDAIDIEEADDASPSIEHFMLLIKRVSLALYEDPGQLQEKTRNILNMLIRDIKVLSFNSGGYESLVSTINQYLADKINPGISYHTLYYYSELSDILANSNMYNYSNILVFINSIVVKFINVGIENMQRVTAIKANISTIKGVTDE